MLMIGRFTSMLFLLCAVALFSVSAKAQTGTGSSLPAPAPTAAQKEDYAATVKRLKGGEQNVDFGALRIAFTETRDYSGYDDGDRAKLIGALNAKDYKGALNLANARLEKDFVDLNAHYVAAIANNELKNHDQAEFHTKIFNGLMDSIILGRDGLTAANAYDVISTTEEYIVMGYLGYGYPSSQALMEENGHHYDKLTATNSKTKKTAGIYFNIDRFFGKMF
jgi:hypothetical protein